MNVVPELSMKEGVVRILNVIELGCLLRLNIVLIVV